MSILREDGMGHSYMTQPAEKVSLCMIDSSNGMTVGEKHC